jgi:hypothetical protein
MIMSCANIISSYEKSAPAASESDLAISSRATRARSRQIRANGWLINSRRFDSMALAIRTSISLILVSSPSAPALQACGMRRNGWCHLLKPKLAPQQ